MRECESHVKEMRTCVIAFHIDVGQGLRPRVFHNEANKGRNIR